MKETFGQRFTRLRKEHGFTQGDLAGKLKISAQAISKWENDLSAPDVTLLGDIADIFGITIDELLGREKDGAVKMAPNLPIVEVPQTDGQIKTAIDKSKIVVQIKIVSSDGDIIKMNLPLALVEAMASKEADGTLKIHGMGPFDKVDLKQVVDLAEKGVTGNLVTINSKEGDVVKVYVATSDDPDGSDNDFRSGKERRDFVLGKGRKGVINTDSPISDFHQTDQGDWSFHTQNGTQVNVHGTPNIQVDKEGKVSVVSTRSSALQEDLTEDEREDLEDELDDLKDELDDVMDEIADLKEDMDDASVSDLGRIVNKISRKTQKASRLQSEIDQLKAQLGKE